MTFWFGKTDQSEQDGADPVGDVRSITGDEYRLLHCIRVWMAKPEYQQDIWNTLSVELGPNRARAELRAFEAFISNISVSIDRRLARHAPDCRCLGRDEAALLNIVRLAGQGDRFSATAHAATMVREDRVEPVVDAAEWLGHTMMTAAVSATSQTSHSGPMTIQ